MPVHHPGVAAPIAGEGTDKVGDVAEDVDGYAVVHGGCVVDPPH